MAPVRKSRSINKRFSNETSPEKAVANSSKSKQRKKLSSKLGPQWSKEELERFYNAYRKHGQNWRKVAAAVRNNRSIEMVESLFNMNRAYLSLPEGTASVAGLVAMMTDHYNVMDRSDSEGDGHDVSAVPRKYAKRKRAKDLLSDSREGLNPSQTIASSDGCLSFLKQAHAYGTQRRATGKRTPRFPVPNSYRKDNREGYSPLNKRIRKSLDSNDDVARILALALTDASKQDWVESSQERRHGKEASDKDAASMIDMEGVGTVEVFRKGRKYYGKQVKVEEREGNNSNDSGEACSGTEGRKRKSQKGKVDIEVATAHGQKKRKKLLFGDEFDAVQALAELSTSMLPANLMESESSAQLKEERNALYIDDKSSTPEETSTSHPEEKPRQSEPKEKVYHAVSGVGISNYRRSKFGKRASIDDKSFAEMKRQPQSTSGASKRNRKPKMIDAEAPMDSHQNKSMHSKESAEDENKSVVKTKRAGQISPSSKQLKPMKMPEKSYSNSDQRRPLTDLAVSSPQVSSLSMPKKLPSRRKINLKRTLQENAKYSEDTLTALSDRDSLSEQELQKVRLSSFLSYPLARRWCTFEWLYSAIDYPWFAKMEFVDYLNHVGLGHVPRLARLEWSVIKSSLGRPRRFSEKFLLEEREKLKQYRECVRSHYTELRTGAREGLPTDLARPLSVGNRVIAIHPKTREIHDGKILTVDHNKCSILFDRSELGVEFVADIDCRPLNPLEYMPEALRRQIFSVDKCSLILKEAQMNGLSNCSGSVMFPSSRLENVSFPTNPLIKQGDTNQSNLQGKTSATNTSSAQLATYNQSTRLALTHTLEKKVLEPEMLGIFKDSRSKARAMVDAAIVAASSVKEGEEDAYKKIREALDSIDKHRSIIRSAVPGVIHHEHVNGSLDHYSQSLANTSEPLVNASKSDDSSEKKELQMPSELITSCVATWLMIQRCTERQYPPADVAQLIDSAVTSLHPRCPQNLPIFTEIQTCMGRIKTQILALIPT